MRDRLPKLSDISAQPRRGERFTRSSWSGSGCFADRTSPSGTAITPHHPKPIPFYFWVIAH
ncbi:MAG: hypothetical protein QNJ70_22640 [Xenococcaceae cyanobacterium MO_207.B15]|nr:hypothetical protein [Xenococcaceae cyanobacterium MO_207.B15]